jgi:GT2 family glycosyltransferase
MSNPKLIIGIATIDSVNYITNTISHLQEQLKECFLEYKIVLSVNGNIQTYQFLTEQYPNFMVLYTEQAGKNTALNKIIQYAKDNHYDIIHFFDDDVRLKNNAIAINLQELINDFHTVKQPSIVASHILRVELSLKYFIQKYGLFQGLKSYYYWQVFSQPFTENACHPNFVIGSAYGLLVRDTPFFPEDNNIADDGFIGNYFALRNKNNPIKHPDYSIAYVNITYNKQEWLKQWLRIHLGVMKSYDYFK